MHNYNMAWDLMNPLSCYFKWNNVCDNARDKWNNVLLGFVFAKC